MEPKYYLTPTPNIAIHQKYVTITIMIQPLLGLSFNLCIKLFLVKVSQCPLKWPWCPCSSAYGIFMLE